MSLAWHLPYRSYVMPPKVYLIGAGPGDVELLTLKALRALARADVVLIDDLASREVLRWTKPA